MNVEKFPHLFEPIQIRGQYFKNRMFAAPQGYYLMPSDSHPNADMIAYWEAKARGGFASICVGDADVHTASGSKGADVPKLDDPSSKSFLAALAAACYRHGCVPTIELNHGGMFSYGNLAKGKPIYGPSAGVYEIGRGRKVEIQEMPEDMILEIIDAFGKAALFAKNLGFGMVNLHAGHGWLVHQFFSERLNHRTDKWGGSFENRARFAIEVVDSIRKYVGPDFPIEARISAAERVLAPDGSDGYGIDEGIRFAKLLDGRVDLIHCSAGTHEVTDSVTISHPTMFAEDQLNSKYAAAIKPEVKSFVATVGSFSDPQNMENFIAEGKADVIEMARQSLADPDLPTKARTGRADEVNQCIRCMQCYRTGTQLGLHYCSINPRTSRERTVLMAPAPKKKEKVLVAGGGIAGMEAALVAAQRGHEVILCEKSDKLGGVLLCEDKVPFKRHLKEYIERQQMLLGRAGVEIRMNTEVTPEFAKSLHPDCIIAAFGSVPVKPNIEGIDGKNVVGIIDAYEHPEKLGDKIVVIGGGMAGTEFAIYMTGLGKKATVVEMKDDYTLDNCLQGRAIKIQIRELGIETHLSTSVSKITDKGIVAKTDDKEFEIEADSIVYATGQKPLIEECNQLAFCADEFFVVGDSLRPVNIMHATHTAFAAAYDIATI